MKTEDCYEAATEPIVSNQDDESSSTGETMNANPFLNLNNVRFSDIGEKSLDKTLDTVDAYISDSDETICDVETEKNLLDKVRSNESRLVDGADCKTENKRENNDSDSVLRYVGKEIFVHMQRNYRNFD